MRYVLKICEGCRSYFKCYSKHPNNKYCSKQCYYKYRIFSDSTRQKISESKKGDNNCMKNAEVRKKSSISHLGQRAWNKGIPMCEETKQKLIIINTGRKQSPETRLKKSLKLKGLKRSKEFCQRISIKLKGKLKSPEHRLHLSLAQKGVKRNFTAETRKKLSKGFSGNNNPMKNKAIAKGVAMKLLGRGKKIYGKNKYDSICIICQNKFKGYDDKQKCCSQICAQIYQKPRIMRNIEIMNNSLEVKEKRRLSMINSPKCVMPFKDSKPELLMQSILYDLNIVFIKHKPIINIKHSYKCDIFLPNYNCVIEVDGKYWHNYPLGNERDHIRTKELVEAGYKILRFWENEFDRDVVKNKLDELEISASNVSQVS